MDLHIKFITLNDCTHTHLLSHHNTLSKTHTHTNCIVRNNAHFICCVTFIYQNNNIATLKAFQLEMEVFLLLLLCLLYLQISDSLKIITLLRNRFLRISDFFCLLVSFVPFVK